MRRAAFLALILALWLTGCGDSDAGVEEAPAYLVSVTAGDMRGSGILYDADENYLYVLTAGHVAQGLGAEGEAWLRFGDGWETRCGDVTLCGTADLALFRIGVRQVPKKRREAYRCADWDKESFDGLRPGDGCAAVGFDPEKGLARLEGSVLDSWIYMEDYGQYMIWADVEIAPGMSGGGLLDEEGRLIGILSGGSEDGETAAVPLSLIWQFLEDVGSNSSDTPPAKSKLRFCAILRDLRAPKRILFAFCVHQRNSSATCLNCYCREIILGKF